jgi:hypothetical protein
MHRGRMVVGVNKNIATKHYSTRSAKVVWGLWVLGLHEEAHWPRAWDKLTGPLPFGEKDNNCKIKPLDDHVHFFLHIVWQMVI